MALTAQLSSAGITPRRIHTGANVKLEKVGEGFSITTIELETQADISCIDDATFQEYALNAKQNCPVSKALPGTEIHTERKAALVNTIETNGSRSTRCALTVSPSIESRTCSRKEAVWC